MARIRDSQPKNNSGSYDRLFGNAELGLLISKVQSTSIRAGNELESIILAKVRVINDLDAFLQMELMHEGVFIAPKREIKRCQTLDFGGSEPDFMVFKRRGGVQTCHIIELKDGHVFDTKKASAERQSMHGFIESNAQHIQYRFQAHFCAFNQSDKQVVWNGFKRRISLEEAMTGPEFCDLLEIDYASIVNERQADSDDNVEFFLSELVRIDGVRGKLRDLLKDDS